MVIETLLLTFALLGVATLLQTLSGFGFGLIVVSSFTLLDIMPLTATTFLVSFLSLFNSVSLVFKNTHHVNKRAFNILLETVERAAVDFSINAYSADASGIEILSGAVTSRRVAVISTDGPVRISKTQGGPSFTVDGVLTHPANGALWASADEAVNVEVLEYLN